MNTKHQDFSLKHFKKETKNINMKKLLFVITAILFSCNVNAQVSKADSLRNIGQIDKAIIEYKKSLSFESNNKNNLYNLACAYALTYFQKDSSFFYLEKALKNDSTLWALSDPDLIALIEDERWNGIIEMQMAKYQIKNGMLKNPEYAQKLLKLIMKDQALDYQIDLAKRQYMINGVAPHWYYPIAEMKKNISSNNFDEMQHMLNKYGWPKYSVVGKLAADAPLLVINHNESDEVRKKYLEVIKENCLLGEGSCMEYAKIQDRILVNSGEAQIYGMQFHYDDERKLVPFPVIEPEYVNQRRAAIGLEPIQEYLKRKIDYDWNIIQKEK